jgi:iron complex outermembrane receptor protein
VLRGYLANAEKVRVRGFEFDSSARFGPHVSVYARARSRRQVRLVPDAPPPFEETGGPR